MNRGDLTNEQWERFTHILPPQKPETGRPNNDHRLMVNGILWIVRTGAPWRDLPERYGSWNSVYSRFRRWKRVGIWDRVLAELQSQGDLQNEIDWEIHFVDGGIVRAHQHASGAKKSTQTDEALGRSQGGLSTKIHIRCDGQGKPITFLLTPGQPHELSVAEQLNNTIRTHSPTNSLLLDIIPSYTFSKSKYNTNRN